ncbi:transcriptional regulator, LysR family [Methylophilus rhizosphaerae]|uniref:Transcriptional regulator, LysR family n=1 Tax=Methylophilus rhizosphaerae TaxID=492660 RepID=A0A1G9CDG0_9PROT|nr:LysR family transcriptional regulator [Methylophilus rhizosphaerae]SDK49667.1 transcriptional regulator, LysR family [Methylophilus rhizosphaerae]
MTSLEEMRFFVEVVKHGNFTSAARALGISKQLVSRRIIALEAHLGVRLLLRTTRKLSPTETGKLFFQRAQHILQAMHDVELEISNRSDELRGLLKISAPLSYARLRLAPALMAFMQQHPLVEVWLEADNRHVDMIGEGYDMVIRVTNQPEEGMVARKLEDAAVRYCCSPDYIARYGTPASPQALATHACLTHRASEWLFSGNDQIHRIPVHPRLKSNHGEVLRDAALAGLGITGLPAFYVLDDLQSGRLVEVLAEYRMQQAGIYAMYPYHKQVSSNTLALIEHLRQWFGSDHA